VSKVKQHILDRKLWVNTDGKWCKRCPLDKDLFYIDGYDKEHNVVLEYDGKYHNKTYQKRKDLIRQQKIIEILKPKRFWRYNKVDNSFIECISNKKEPTTAVVEQ